jgi:LysM repeat protein
MGPKGRQLLSIVLMIGLAGASVGSAAAAPNADGPNLLQNPGFEAPYGKQCCQTDLSLYYPNTPIAEVQVAWGWLGWWLQPGDAAHPGSGGNPSWHRPEWREANCGPVCANRIHSGNDAQKYFTFWSVHDAGMLQQVPNISPGTVLRFSVYMQAWSTNTNYGASDHIQTMGMRVGIDPFGGTDAFSPNVIWSDPADTFDAWGLYTIQAVAQSNTVTVFTRSTPHYGMEHNDIYIDDASLVAVSPDNSGGGGNNVPPSNNPPPAPTEPAPAPTEVPAQLPGFNYVVVRGDNYYEIAQRFGVSLALLYQVNHIFNTRVLFVGTVLFIPTSNPPPDDTGGQVDNNPPPPAPAPTATTPPDQLPGAFAYTVQRGDNLFRLSLRFGVSVARIKQLNGLFSDVIFVGQTLIIAP